MKYFNPVAELFRRKKKKETAADRREQNDRRPNIPARSMTEEEKEYYDKHKNLNNFQPKQ